MTSRTYVVLTFLLLLILGCVPRGPYTSSTTQEAQPSQASSYTPSGRVQVRGYTRANGTHVHSYSRRR